MDKSIVVVDEHKLDNHQNISVHLKVVPNSGISYMSRGKKPSYFPLYCSF